MSLFNFIKTNISILDIVSEYVTTKQAGGYLKGSCPFHSETDASFTISPERQMFYCFGCHASGDAISFVAKIENLSQIEAARYLIDKYKIIIPQDLKQNSGSFYEQTESKDSYLHTCEVFASWAHYQLSLNYDAKEYLRLRNIDSKEIKTFQIGYMPGGLRAINQFILDLSKKNVLVQNLLDAGILQDGGKVLHSPFEERIIFPIKDSLGRHCGFGGRIFKPRDQRPKYYNSKESPSFLKGKLLFGFDLAKKSMQQKQFAFLVEGYTDCIMMAKYGYTNTVATLGTACTQEHLKLLSRQISTLFVLYDGDSAGQNAILRLTELCWEVNLELKIIQLPTKEDPASFLSKEENLDSLISSATDIFEFFIEKVGQSFHQKSLSEKLDKSKKILLLLSKITDPLKQDLLIQRASAITLLPFETLKNSLTTVMARQDGAISDKKQNDHNLSTKNSHESSFDAMPLLEKKILFAMINTIKHACRINFEKDLISYFSQVAQLFLNKLYQADTCKDPQEICSVFFNSLDETERNWINKQSIFFNEIASEHTSEKLLFEFKKQKWKEIVKDIRSNLLKAEKLGNKKDFQEIMNKFLGLKKEMKSKGLL